MNNTNYKYIFPFTYRSTCTIKSKHGVVTGVFELSVITYFIFKYFTKNTLNKLLEDNIQKTKDWSDKVVGGRAGQDA